MRQITTNVYTFDELSDEAKQKAIEWYREGLEYNYLEDQMQDELTEHLLPKYKITPIDVTVRYSLSYSQGDGASFTGDIEWGAYRATIATNQWGHYSHSRSVSVTELNSLKTDKDAPATKWAELEVIIENIGGELAKYGYSEIEYQASEDVCIEMIQANEYEFNDDGGIA